MKVVGAQSPGCTRDCAGGWAQSPGCTGDCADLILLGCVRGVRAYLEGYFWACALQGKDKIAPPWGEFSLGLWVELGSARPWSACEG